MTFAINPSLNYIDITEQSVCELYRSKGEILLSDARFRGHPCEAFICISRVEKKMKAYVALLEMGMKSVFVYTSDYSTENSAEYPAVFAEADEFVTSMGFSMDRVNLEFSPAMREVIIKGFRVMRPPPKKAPIRTNTPQQPPPQTAVAAFHSSPERPAHPEDGAAAGPAELVTLQTALASAKATLERVTREKLLLEQSASREIALLRSAAEKAAAAKHLCEERFSKEIESVKDEMLATAARQQGELIQTLQSELDSAVQNGKSTAKTLSTEISALNAKIASFEQRTEQLLNELATVKIASTETISRLTAENDALNSLLAAEKTTAADKIASLALFEASWRESQHREEDLCRHIDSMKAEIDRLEAELLKHQLKEDRESALILRVASLEEEAADSRTEQEQLIRRSADHHALEELLQSLNEAKNDIEAEYIRMANEAMEKETRMLETLYFADSEILRLSRELELQQNVAAMEKAALRDELESTYKERVNAQVEAEVFQRQELSAAAASPPADEPCLTDIEPIEPEVFPAAVSAESPAATASPPALQAAAAAALPAEEDFPDGPVSGAPEITAGLINEFGSFHSSGSHTAMEFKVDPDLRTLEYSDPAEVAAVLYSSNSVQAVPDGSRTERCKGFVIATKIAGEYRAYVAWHLTESNKTVICVPDQQPADAVECTQVLLDAIAYFEIVGLMMELMDLGSTVKSYHNAIRKVPALSRK